MEDFTAELIMRYFGSDVPTLRLLGITNYAIRTYVQRVRGGQSKESATNALLRGRSLDPEQIQFVRSVLDRFPMVKNAGG
jgi:hypothetical protein